MRCYYLQKIIKSLVINFSNERLNKKIPFSSPLTYEEMSGGYTEEELGIPYQDLEDETDAIIDIGTLVSYLIDLIFLFKEEKRYKKYLTENYVIQKFMQKNLLIMKKI